MPDGSAMTNGDATMTGILAVRPPATHRVHGGDLGVADPGREEVIHDATLWLCVGLMCQASRCQRAPPDGNDGRVSATS